VSWSNDWRALRRFTISQQLGLCAEYEEGICVGELDLHHFTYARLGNEWPSDVVALCRVHHDERHGFRESADVCGCTR